MLIGIPKKSFVCFFCGLFLCALQPQKTYAQNGYTHAHRMGGDIDYDGDTDQLKTLNYAAIGGTHDLQLSSWGPYSKKYAGISHIADIRSGLRFDLSVVISQNEHKCIIPNVRFESGYHPWQASNDLTRYSYRYELEWKDQLYADVHYQIIDSLTAAVAIKYVNNTDQFQQLDADLMASVSYPENYSSIKLPVSPNMTWKNAIHYESLQFAHPNAKDYLPDNGWLKAEIRDSRFIDGRAVGKNFGKDSGDRASYQLRLPAQFQNGSLAIAYQLKVGKKATFKLSGLVNKTVVLSGTGKLAWKTVRIDRYSKSMHPSRLKLVALGGDGNGNGNPVDLNGFLIISGPKPQVKANLKATPATTATLATSENSFASILDTLVKTQPQHLIPKKVLDRPNQQLFLKYPDLPIGYTISWPKDQEDAGKETGKGSDTKIKTRVRVREFQNDQLDVFYREKINDHVSSVFRGNQKGDYTALGLPSLTLAPHSQKWVYASFSVTHKKQPAKPIQYHLDRLFTAADRQGDSNAALSKDILPVGKKYALGGQLLKATLMTNVTYPIYTQDTYIRHFTPGKWWNSIYTWDLGFIAEGLIEINPSLAAQCLNAYTTAPGSWSPFVFHGSPVPTQQYGFFDLWNKTQSKPLLHYFYPRLKQYYQFLAGHAKGSTTTKFKSGILSTWDYFYNSGGWDDYPAQVAVHRGHLENKVAPVITTAQMIRVAKMLRMAALQLGKNKDAQRYKSDIITWGNALQKYSWNKKSGYFSYVEHSADGQSNEQPTKPFLYQDSIDYNKGLDGAYPLLAGICTPDQQKTLLNKIFSPKHMWTKVGISVVDQSAPYYQTGGYWNGKVWMPHQWFMWKTMLDLGRGDLAYKIAKTALDVYQQEVQASYDCLEYFSPTTGRGGGWHQFSGLSSPVLNWFNAYYKIGTVTTGFEIWIRQQNFNSACDTYNALLSFDDATAAHGRTMLICMTPNHRYKASFNGQTLSIHSPYSGLLAITLPATNQKGRLIVQPVD